MAIEKTVFNEESLKQEVEKNYGCRVLHTEPVGFASANIYRMETDRGVYCMKEFPRKITEEMAGREGYICRHLLKNGFSVPHHVKTKAGSSYFIYEGHCCIVYHWLEGERMSAGCATGAQLIESAELYANLLTAMEGLSIKLPTPSYFDHTATAIDQSIIEHKVLLQHAEHEEVGLELTYKIQMLERFKNFDWSGAEHITWKNSHGDYNPFQFLYQEGKITSVLDFMSAKYMPIAFELFRNFLYMDLEAMVCKLDEGHLSDYLCAFAAHHPLSEYDRKFMIPLYYLRILTSTFGYREYCRDPKQVEYLRLGRQLFEQCVWLEKIISDSRSPRECFCL